MIFSEAIRILNDKSIEKVRVWTIQTEEAWMFFCKNGYLRTDGRKVNKNFKQAYDWLVRQMIKKGLWQNKKVKYPVWIWYFPKPDLCYHLYGFVRIDFIIKKDLVLWSNLIIWDTILTNSMHNFMFCKDNKIKHQLDAWCNDLFNLEKRIDMGEYNIQGILPTLDANDIEVVDVKKITKIDNY